MLPRKKLSTIADPSFSAPFVGAVEVLFGTSIIVGFATRLSAVPLASDISVAIATTKIPMLLDMGFWEAAHEARTDLSMLLGLVFLLIEGAGPLSMDHRLSRGLDGRNQVGVDTQEEPRFERKSKNAP